MKNQSEKSNISFESIAILVPHIHYSGGTERVVTTLSNYFFKQKIHVTIIVMGKNTSCFYPLIKEVPCISLNLPETNNNLFAVIINNIQRIFKTIRIIRKLKPDILLGIGSIANIFVSLTKVILADVITFGSEHTHPPQFPLDKTRCVIRSLSYKYLDAVVTLTEETSSWVQKNTTAKQVVVIPNPVLYPMLNSAPEINPKTIITANNKILLAVGRLDKGKGFDLLITAFSKLAVKHTNWQLVILGEGKERNTLEQQIKQLNLQNKISLPGVVGNLADWYKIAEIFVFSSRYEGFPCVLIEAMVHGLPVVSFDCKTGPSDIITHGVDGLLVPAENINALTKALDKIIANEKLRKQFAGNAIGIRERFSVENIAYKWDNLFKQIQKIKI